QTVGESRVAGLTVDRVGHEAHRDSRNGGLERNTRVEQRERRGAHGTHRSGAVGAERLGDLADGVGEVLAAWKHGHEGTLCERPVADLATLGAAHTARLARGEGREV